MSATLTTWLPIARSRIDRGPLVISAEMATRDLLAAEIRPHPRAEA